MYKQFMIAAGFVSVAVSPIVVNAAANQFNPAISLVLDGGYASYDNDPEAYELPGFALGGESGLSARGMSLGHSELILSSNIDDQFFGQFTLAFAEHEGELETELEEAFFETTALGNGLTLRGGRFFSNIGYLNRQHEHTWMFRDAPLIYRGLFGKNYIDDGLRLSWLAPTDLYINIGIESMAANGFPAGGEHAGTGASTLYLHVGGDIDASSSWLFGLSQWSADELEREYGGHDHGGAAETPLFEGESDITGVFAIYKWAPGGNRRAEHIELSFESFQREENGSITLLDSVPLETSSLSSEQEGWYLQAIWGFSPNWRTGVRFDRLSSKNTGSDTATLDEAGLMSNGHDPERLSLMLEWVPSEFSRIRFQFNQDDSSPMSDDQLFVQYTFSIGAHGAHSY